MGHGDRKSFGKNRIFLKPLDVLLNAFDSERPNLNVISFNDPQRPKRIEKSSCLKNRLKGNRSVEEIGLTCQSGQLFELPPVQI